MSNHQPVESEFNINSSRLQLHRYPRYRNEQLRAWDAADEYLLNHLAELNPTKNCHALVVNDQSGALSLSLLVLDQHVTSLSDSSNSHLAITANMQQNQLQNQAINIINSSEFSAQNNDKNFDLVLIKIPKSLAQLEDNLRLIRPRLSKHTIILGAAMTKNIHRSTLALFEQILGETKTSLAKKKARLIFSQISNAGSTIEAPAAAQQFIVDKEISNTAKPLYIHSYASVFSHAKLDLGTRFLLEAMVIPETAKHILDLGCGTGILGLAAALRAPEAMITFVDESYRAIESTRESIAASLSETQAKRCSVLATHCLNGIEDQSQDLILNNPPFHDVGGQSSLIALQMFTESKRVLRKGGTLLVVANLHLGYHKRLKEIFGRCELVAKNNKFVVLKAIHWQKPTDTTNQQNLNELSN